MKEALITVQRDTYTSASTIGKLYVNNKFICDTLEDVCRDLNFDGDLDDAGEAKIFGETAIPAGKYKMIINISPRFKKLLPRLIGIKDFDGVLIHSGNVPANTHGCILVGTRGKDCLLGGTSVNALNKLMAELKLYDVYEIQILDKK